MTIGFPDLDMGSAGFKHPSYKFEAPTERISCLGSHNRRELSIARASSPEWQAAAPSSHRFRVGQVTICSGPCSDFHSGRNAFLLFGPIAFFPSDRMTCLRSDPSMRSGETAVLQVPVKLPYAKERSGLAQFFSLSHVSSKISKEPALERE